MPKEIERKWLLASDHYFSEFGFMSPAGTGQNFESGSMVIAHAKQSNHTPDINNNFFQIENFLLDRTYVLLSVYLTPNTRIRCKFPDGDTSFLIFETSMYPHTIMAYYDLNKLVDSYKSSHAHDPSTGMMITVDEPEYDEITFEKTTKNGSGLIRDEINEEISLDTWSFFNMIKEQSFPFIHKIRTDLRLPESIPSPPGIKQISYDWFPNMEMAHLMQNEFSKISTSGSCNYYKYNGRTIVCNKAPVILEIEFDDEQSAIDFDINSFGKGINHAIIKEVTDETIYNNYMIANWKQDDFVNHFKLIEKFIEAKGI